MRTRTQLIRDLISSVLAAFFATASITIIAVLFAYSTQSLDDDLLTELDRRFLAWAGERVRMSLGINGVATVSSGKRQMRKETIKKFVLALSDQQLVTGLAILIAGISGQSHLSGYEFQVVLSLAWFSSTTHMATIDLLRNEFNSQGFIREVRVVGMLIVLAMLIYTFVISLQISNSALPMSCNGSSAREGSDLNSTYAIIIAAYFLALLLILSGYFVRLFSLYFGKRTLKWASSWVWWRATQYRLSDTSSAHAIWFEEHEAASRVSTLLRFANITSGTSHRHVRWIKQRIIVSSYSYQHSFLSTIPSLCFSFTYGIAQVVGIRWTSAPSLSSESAEWGFGQIISLFLLCLPFLSAGEAYFGEFVITCCITCIWDTDNHLTDYHKKLREHLQQQASHTSQRNNSSHKIVDHPVEELQISLATAEDEYSSHESSIRNYLPTEVRRGNLSTAGKQRLLDKYRGLKSIEEEVYDIMMSTVYAVFLYQMIQSIVLGILLNLTDFVPNLIGILLFITSLALQIIDEVSEMPRSLRGYGDVQRIPEPLPARRTADPTSAGTAAELQMREGAEQPTTFQLSNSS